MDPRDQRPPRSARPPSSAQLQQKQEQQLPSFPDQSYSYNNDSSATRPPLSPNYDSSRAGVSFQNPVRPERQRTGPSPYQNSQLPGYDAEQGEVTDPSRVGRKKSLVRPDREKIEPGHRQWHYRTHVAQAENEGSGRVGVMPSSAFYCSSSQYMPLI